MLGAPKFKLEQPVQVLEQVVQGMSVFLLTTNMRLFLNPIINHISSPILICKIPSSKVISYIICEIYKLLPPILICEKYWHKRLTDKLLEQVVQGIGLALQALARLARSTVVLIIDNTAVFTLGLAVAHK